jgi:hypothetical protein
VKLVSLFNHLTDFDETWCAYYALSALIDNNVESPNGVVVIWCLRCGLDYRGIMAQFSVGATDLL